MPVEYAHSDIFQVEAEALVNSVNCVGVMGRGIALQFKERYPDNFKQYKAACDRGELEPGRMFVTEMGKADGPRYIINFPTKRHWRGKSQLKDIQHGLRSLAEELDRRAINSVALPALATDLGGLAWPIVRGEIERVLIPRTKARVVVFEPGSAPSDGRRNRSTDPPAMTPGRAALIAMTSRYLHASLDQALSLLELHKLMYLLQEAGEPLNLRLRKETYGPYAVNLRHVLKAMNNHYITGYGDGGDNPTKLIQLLPGAAQDARAYLASQYPTYGRIRRVLGAMEGFESPSGLELLTTVHWVATREGAETPDKAIEMTYAWNERKRQFADYHIRLAYERLSEQGWISTSPDTST